MKAIASVVILAVLIVNAPCAAQSLQPENFISRRGDKLYDGDHEFCFVSFNIPNLHLVEDDFAPSAARPFRWPDEFEISDALESVRQMGGTVARTYVLSVAREGSGMGDTVFVTGPNLFNEDAFRTLDLVLKLARDKGIRLIVPLVDQWHWMGGRAQYAAFRGKQPDDFWSDDVVIADFEATLRYVLNRENTLTGVAYKDDPTIFGWETGNEISSPPTWTRRIAALLKSIDSRHLIIDGNSLHGVQPVSLEDNNIDVVTTHHYPGPGRNMLADIRQARAATRGKKPYFVGEFGFIPREELSRVLELVQDEGIAGALLWSLRYHHRDGGFFWHSEPLGAGLYKAYHWPGFASGSAYEEVDVLRLIRRKAYEIRGLAEPPTVAPTAPRLLAIDDVSAISWQGSAGASGYDVQRAEAAAGPWVVVGPNVSDAALQYAPLFHDDTASPGISYFYRVVALNEAGKSTPSNVIGPVPVRWRTLVDECADLGRVHSYERAAVRTGDDRRTREDQSRIAVAPGGHVEYESPGDIASWQVIVFYAGQHLELEVAGAVGDDSFAPVEIEKSMHDGLGADYGYLRCATLSGSSLPVGTRRLLLKLPEAAREEVQISRLKIHFGVRP